MRTFSVTLFVAVAALGLSACFGDDFFDDDNYYGAAPYSMGYGGGYGGGVARAPYAAPMYLPPPAAYPVGGYGDDGGLFGDNNGLIFMLLLLPFLLSNSNGGLLG